MTQDASAQMPPKKGELTQQSGEAAPSDSSDNSLSEQTERAPQKQSARYIVGIDLGTTNTALSYADLMAEDPAESVRDLPIRQLIAPGEVAERPLLPSNLYIPTGEEIAAGVSALPWDKSASIVAGHFARVRGRSVPRRFISSAKSWLCHPSVDRTAPILPWGEAEDVQKLSPVDAQSHYLSHLVHLWNAEFPEAPIESQEVVLTVPASFDQMARMLTLEAARRAGIGHLTLIEEPLAAFYDWTRRHRGQIDKALGDNRIILVVDVGGGTTDLTLIEAKAGGKGPALRRLSVGRHLLLGGDNMDTALARLAEAKFGQKLDASDWQALIQSAREAKERLLSPTGPSEASVGVLSRGSRLIGSARSAVLKREDVTRFLLDGFFPQISARDRPARPKRLGLLEAGLPYETDPAITRHVAAFLSDHAREVSPDGASAMVLPDAVLLNGGVFSSEALSTRLLEVIDSWKSAVPGITKRIRLLDNDALDLAVSRGAVAYGLVRRGLGLRIGGGSPRAYFIGVAGSGTLQQGVCIVPRHLEEDAEVEIPRTFRLTLDNPASFSLYASNQAVDAVPGDVADVTSDGFVPLPPIRTVLRSQALWQRTQSGTAADSGKIRPAAKAEIPVRLKACLTEIGTLELWCAAEENPSVKWRLEFGLREGGSGIPDDARLSKTADVVPMPKNFGEAKDRIEVIFGKKPAPVDRRDVKNLTRDLEKLLGPKSTWPTPLIRELWGALYAGVAKRRRTAEHERMWCSLTGFALRPGFGAHLDDWRVSETFRTYAQGLQFQNEPHNWEAWWVMWRRIAGGLDAKSQEEIFDASFKFVKLDGRNSRSKTVPGLPELIRLLASLERISADRKSALKDALFGHLQSAQSKGPHVVWALGRLLARVPLYASAHTCVPADSAETALDRLIASAERHSLTQQLADFAPAAAQIARISGDRSRDLSEDVRNRTLKFLQNCRASDELILPVREFLPPTRRDEERSFGESLPPGLTLLKET